MGETIYQLTDVLAECSLFLGVPSPEFSAILAQMQTFQVPQGRILIHRGDTSKDTYFLVKGRALGQLVSDHGKEILFSEIVPGQYFGELAALDGEPRSITISASTDCILAKLSEDDFCDMLLEHPQTAVNLATDLALRLRGMNERVFGLVVHDVDTRVRHHIMRLAQAQEQLVPGGLVEDVPTHEVLARFIGANREAVSRAMAKLSKNGVISTERGKVTLLDLPVLIAGLEDTDN